ncbi:MAG TPA: IS110 family transposase [Verrucomicrobiae bacterium]
MKTNENEKGRVVGFDSHPDSFTAAILNGPTPAAATVEKMFNKLPMGQLTQWAKKHTGPEDQIVLEASGNSFQVVRQLAKIGRKAKVLESCQMGKLKEAHANNDKISAVRIGKAYLAGTAKEVWVPDAPTQERRDWYHAYRKTVKRSGQVRSSLRSYLSDNGVRLKKHIHLTKPAEAEAAIRSTQEWTPHQWRVIEGKLLELRHAEDQRAHWHQLMAQEVLEDPELLALVRLCGVREITAFAIGAFIGDIHRFASAKKLVKYIGFNPAFDDSGQDTWSGGIGGHGHRILRSLLVEGAQAILRCSNQPLAHWGKKLLARKGAINLAVCAMARKLTVAIWYLMMGRWSAVEEIEAALDFKVRRLVSLGSAADKTRPTRKRLCEQAFASLKAGKTYVLKKTDWKFESKPVDLPATASLAPEYGLS